MFICPDCEKTKMEYARGHMRSTGQCEICDKVDNCLDARDYKEKPHSKCEPHENSSTPPEDYADD